MATPKKKPEDLLKVGRPSKYKPEYCQTMINLMREGLSVAEVASHFDISKQTFHEWLKMFPEFADAFNVAKTKSEALWTRWGRENISNKEFNSRLFEINMMNRFDWMKKSEAKQEVKVSFEEALKDLE